MLSGESVRALVVGGGNVAQRKVAALIESGAAVRLVAPDITPELSRLAQQGRIEWIRESYSASLLGDSNLVFAATGSPEVNADVARAARESARLVNVASDAESGDFFTPATHRDGPLVLAVFASGVPAAASRLRDHLRNSLGRGLAGAVELLRTLRKRQLDAGDAAAWTAASSELIGDDFVAAVESGEFSRRAERWRS
jgi:precorrin-2 dehydrogenase/sirohydrochlorin ferrochelatase